MARGPRYAFASASDRLSFGQKLLHVNWPLVLLLSLTAGVGVAMLYSAANGQWTPWAARHAMRFGIGAALMLAIGLTDVRLWMRYAYVIYALTLGALAAVEIAGDTGMGAQRWISLGVINMQPSEVMKISMVLALARYFHGASLEDIARPVFLAVPLLLIAAPALLVLRQPDLGTAIMLLVAGVAVLFVVGVRMWKFAVVAALGLAALPVAWSVLRPYQKRRIFTFLDPESDPLGAGYHILQSKIALGSGGVFGKGYIQGTQSHLNFLPEKQTDFIFTMLAEEFGLLGGLSLLGLYMLLLAYGLAISLRARNQFAQALGIGVTVTVFLYVCINVAMVMGLVPVVGVPLPLISYGGTAMLSVMIGFGLLISASIHRDVPVGRHGSSEGW
jgi:rod shape determining protein RodA